MQVLMSHAAKLRQSLDASPGLSPANVDEVYLPRQSTARMQILLRQREGHHPCTSHEQDND
jgi:hypothetical protein